MALRLLLLLMIVVQAQTMRLMTGFFVFPLLIVMVSLVGVSGRMVIEMNPANRIRFGLLLAAVFAFVAQAYDFNAQGIMDIAVPYKYGVAIAQWSLIVQTACFFLKWKDGPPVFLSLIGCLAMVFVGNKICDQPDHTYYLLCTVVFGMALMVFLALAGSARRPASMSFSYGRGLSALVLLVLAVGFGVSKLVLVAETEATRLYEKLLYGSRASAGFSLHASLGSIAAWQEDDGREVALRIVSASPPGYMRGRMFRVFQKSTWRGEKFDRRILPLSEASAGMVPRAAHENMYDLALIPPPAKEQEAAVRVAPGSTGGIRSLEIWNGSKVGGVIFSPRDARYIGTVAPVLLADRDGALQVQNESEADHYRVHTRMEAKADGPIPSAALQEYRSIPESLDPEVVALAQRITAGCNADPCRIRAVVEYFHSNYKYRLGIRIPGGADPLSYFLLQKPAAHCEYFATGAAALLRLAGVPCRYVTGFAVSEANPVGGYYVARNRDAHAWVEAFSEGRWVTVEATPPEGLPGSASHAESGMFFQLSDTIQFAFQRMFAALRAGAVSAAFQALADITISTVLRLRRTIPGILNFLISNGRYLTKYHLIKDPGNFMCRFLQKQLH